MKKNKFIQDVERRIGEDLETLLNRLYVQERVLVKSIAEKLNVSHGTIRNWLNYFNIKIRSFSEAKLPKEFVKPTKKELEYWRARESTTNIAKRLNVSTTFVCGLFDEYNIQRKTISESKLPPGCVKPTPDTLELLYAQEKLSTTRIAKKFGVTPKTICNWLDDADIQRRKRTERRGAIKPTKEQLYAWYVMEGKNTREIAELAGTVDGTVSRWLKHDKIPARKGLNAHVPTFSMPSKEYLENLYINEHKGTPEIGKLLSISQGTVLKLLKMNGIPLRRMRGAYDLKEYRKSLADEVLRTTGKVPRELTVTDFDKILLENGVTYITVVRWYQRKNSCNPGKALDLLIGDLYAVQRTHKTHEKGAYDSIAIRKNLADELLRALDKNPEELLSSDFEKARQKNGSTYAGLLGWYMREYSCRSVQARDKLLKEIYHTKFKHQDQLENLLRDYAEGEE
jgi:transposase